MKKISTLASLLLCAAMGATAQSVKVLHLDNANEQTINAISNNGQYFCGYTGRYYNGWFTYDIENGFYQSVNAADDQSMAALAIANNGKAVGIVDYKATIFTSDTQTTPLDDNSATSSVASAITADGNTIGGYVTNEEGYITPCYWKRGVLKTLTVPAAEGFEADVYGAEVKAMSSDGNVILGVLKDDQGVEPPIYWKKNTTGDYEVFSPYKGLPALEYGMPLENARLSDNGKYIAFADTYNESGAIIYLYDTEKAEMAKTFSIFDCTATVQGDMPVTQAVTNNGLVYANIYGNSTLPVVANPADGTMKTLFELYPNVSELQAYADGTTCIATVSGDGKKVIGTYTNENGDEEQGEIFLLNTDGNATAIANDAANDVNVKEVARYNLSGMRIDAPAKGINLVKMSNGKVSKVVIR